MDFSPAFEALAREAEGARADFRAGVWLRPGDRRLSKAPSMRVASEARFRADALERASICTVPITISASASASLANRVRGNQ